MRKFNITESAITRAKGRAEKLPLLNNSIRSGEGGVVAYIGEEVAKHVLNAEIKDTYDYDLIYNGTKVDVKTKSEIIIILYFFILYCFLFYSKINVFA